MQTERFKKIEKILDVLYKKEKIVKIWRDVVRNQLRGLDLLDLYDHYELNFDIEDRALSIRDEIMSGAYKASKPLVYRIEKKMGICRHLVIPNAVDALILQVLIEHIGDKVLESQPSGKAFFSRDRHSKKLPHEFSTSDYSWRGQWKQLQKEIYRFNESFELVASTDISNFYDSLDTRELRKVIASFAKVEEVVFDLLFKILEEITWVPDYLPYSQRSLPTANIEAVRLLAHSFLFEIDHVLKDKTNDNFTRWMDDIVIGVNSRKDAVEVLSTISDMLKSRGLALNLAKTHIWNAKEGCYNFQIDENRFLDELDGVELDSALKKDVLKRFKNHLKLNEKPKYWDKIIKRYITLFGRNEIADILPLIMELYISSPSLRDSIISYLEKIGYSAKTSVVINEIMSNLNVFDDISLFQISKLVTAWEVPINKQSKEFLVSFENQLAGFAKKRNLASDFYCLLWFKSKYSHQEELLDFLLKEKTFWQKNPFLRRQALSSMSRLIYMNNPKIDNLVDSQFSSGNLSVVMLANHLKLFSTLDKLETKTSMYLFNEKTKKYGLQRFLVLCSVLNSERIRCDPKIRGDVLSKIKDPYYLRILDSQYNIN